MCTESKYKKEISIESKRAETINIGNKLALSLNTGNRQAQINGQTISTAYTCTSLHTLSSQLNRTRTLRRRQKSSLAPGHSPSPLPSAPDWEAAGARDHLPRSLSQTGF